ncbi:aminotransferase class V-fold PLP-dependent enzyme [Cupriavidus necator]
MIREVTFRKTTYNEFPYKFEAGAPNIAGAIALGAAIEHVSAVGLDAIAAPEHALLAYASAQAARIAGLRMIGTAADKASILSLTLAAIHPHDVRPILDQHGVAVRAGHHCAMPVMERVGVPATVRASFALYNTREEVDALHCLLPRARHRRYSADV